MKPGDVLRNRIYEAGYSIPAAAVAIGLNRSNLNNVLLGKVALTHDMVYRINVLVAPDDDEFEFSRELLGLQAANQWNDTAAGRGLAKVIVEAGRRYGDMVEQGEGGKLNLTAAGARQRDEDEREMGYSPLE